MVKCCRIAFSNDHGGIELKKHLIQVAQSLGYQILDLGPNIDQPVDYPDMARPVCEALLKKEAEYGVLICGSGIGITIAANRYQGIRAALCHHNLMAQLARQHNNANIITFGQRLTTPMVAEDCLKIFLETPFEGGRHTQRVEKLG